MTDRKDIAKAYNNHCGLDPRAHPPRQPGDLAYPPAVKTNSDNQKKYEFAENICVVGEKCNGSDLSITCFHDGTIRIDHGSEYLSDDNWIKVDPRVLPALVSQLRMLTDYAMDARVEVLGNLVTANRSAYKIDKAELGRKYDIRFISYTDQIKELTALKEKLSKENQT